MKILSCITLENGVNMTFEIIKNKLWFEMDEPKDKEMMVTIYEVPSDTYTIIGQGAFTPPTTNLVGDLRSPEKFGQKTEGKETTYHQSALGQKHMLLPGTYIFSFSNDKYIHLSVVLKYNKFSFEVY